MRRLDHRWNALLPRTRTAIKVAALLVIVALAYGYSLLALVANATLETPLAYVSLVPAIALGLAAVCHRPRRAEPPIHDRQVDYIVGVPLIVVAMVINLALPARLSAQFWMWRLDLLSLPMFVAGAVCLIFGIRVLWRQKLAIGYLLLAWPVPYQVALLRVLNGFTVLTLAGLHGALHLAPLAKAATGGDGSIFEVVHRGHAFPVSVVSACSGVNGIVGFLLVGVAFGAVTRGPWFRKLLWLTGGMLLLWCVNIGRLLLLFWSGRQWGEHVAVDIIHPYMGLVTFSLGVLVMLLFMRPMGLHIWSPEPVTAQVDEPTEGRALSIAKVGIAVGLVAATAVVLSVADLGLRAYNLVADVGGEPTLTALISRPVAPAGWRMTLDAQYDWAKPLFGDSSTWRRYALTPPSGAGGDLPVLTADVIDTPDLQSFAAYGVLACYTFHGYSLRDVSQVKVGGGITGQALAFTTGTRSTWSLVYWIAPVRHGTATWYERVVLYVLDSGNRIVRADRAGAVRVTNVAGSVAVSGLDARLIAERDYLASFGLDLIKTQARPGAVAAPSAQRLPSAPVQTHGTVTTHKKPNQRPGAPPDPSVSLTGG